MNTSKEHRKEGGIDGEREREGEKMQEKILDPPVPNLWILNAIE